MDSPYRELAAGPLYHADSREGRVSLELGPRQLRLALGDRVGLSVLGDSAIWLRRRRSGLHRRELALDRARLWPARSYPTGDLALWYESRLGLVERLGGVRPVQAFEAGALGAWRALDRVADELGRALAAHAGGALEAIELGRGQHRVLLVQFEGRLVIHARPLFRERQRRVLEVGSDGTLLVPGRLRDRNARFESRASVTVCGDRIRFADGTGGDLHCLWLPWIALEDRQELARRLAELVDPTPPEPDYEPRARLRPWASGLGRVPPTVLPGPLPGSGARFRR